MSGLAQNRVHPGFIGPYIHLTVCSNCFTNEQESVALADRFQFYRTTPVPSALPFLSGDKPRGVVFMDLVYVRKNYTVSNSLNRVIHVVHVVQFRYGNRLDGPFKVGICGT